MNKQISRRDRTEQKRNIKKAIYFTTLTLVTIIAFVFYGIPAIAKFVIFISDLKYSTEPIEISDNTQPISPSFEPTPEATNKRSLRIKGRTEPGAKVYLKFNGKELESLANVDGEFSQDVTLKDGVNYFSAKSKDASNNESNETQQFSIIYDDKPPELSISKPEDGAEFYGAKDRQILIEGKTEAASIVRINNRFVVVESDGSFTFSTTLVEGTNSFIVSTEDNAGNKTESTTLVNYTS